PVLDMLASLRDPPPAEHDLAHPGRHGPLGSGDIVRQQDPLSLVSLDRHQSLDGNSYIIAFPWGGRSYSQPVNMLSRRWKGFMEQGRFVPTMGKAWVKARKHDRFYRAAKKQSYQDRKSTRLNSSHGSNSYAVFCL